MSAPQGRQPKPPRVPKQNHQSANQPSTMPPVDSRQPHGARTAAGDGSKKAILPLVPPQNAPTGGDGGASASPRGPLRSSSTGTVEEESCIVCSEPLVYCTLMDCGHRGCCSLCSIRLRLLHNDNKCVLCKQVPEKVFIIRQSDKRTHAQIVDQTWGERANRFILDEPSGFFFADDVAGHLAELQRLREPRCETCNQGLFPVCG